MVHRDTYPCTAKGKEIRVLEIQRYTPDPVGREQDIGMSLTAEGILSMGHANHTAGGKAQSGDKQRPPPSAGRDPHPLRVPTRTSRRAGISQGDLPHTKVTTSSLRMQGDHKEQHSSHSLNQWKERFDL